MTMAPEVPAGWRLERLDSVAAVTRGASWSNDQESDIPNPGAVPVVRIGNVQLDGFHMGDTKYIRNVSDADRHRTSIQRRTLVMVGSNGNPNRVGNVFLANNDVTGHLLASFLIAVVPRLDVSERFLAAVLRSPSIQSRITRSTSGSTGLKNIGLRWLRSLRILMPPIAEQRAIAAILDSIDEAIERTEEVIAATERLRDALLQDLLTRGLPGRHTEWKEVRGLGTIPACWNVVRLGDVCDPPEYGASTPARPYDPALPRYVRITDLSDDGRLKEEDLRSADPEAVEGCELLSGDMAFARSGATVGKTYMYRSDDGPCVYAGYLIRFRPQITHLCPEFLELWTHTQMYFAWVKSMLRAGAQPNINATEYASLRIPLPPIEEQERISLSIASLTSMIADSLVATEVLCLVKASVSNQLLKGDLRIPEENLRREGLER